MEDFFKKFIILIGHRSTLTTHGKKQKPRTLGSARVAGDGISLEHTNEGQIAIALIVVESIPHHKLIGYFEA